MISTGGEASSAFPSTNRRPNAAAAAANPAAVEKRPSASSVTPQKSPQRSPMTGDAPLAITIPSPTTATTHGPRTTSPVERKSVFGVVAPPLTPPSTHLVGNGHTTMSHRIPHRFQASYPLAGSTCSVCRKWILGFRKQALKCRDCGYCCHEKCLPLVPASCGLSMDMLSNAIACANIQAPQQTNSVVATARKYHQFVGTTFPSPTLCVLCDRHVWGINVKGKQCAQCKLAVHEECLAKQPSFARLQCGLGTAEDAMDLDGDNDGSVVVPPKQTRPFSEVVTTPPSSNALAAPSLLGAPLASLERIRSMRTIKKQESSLNPVRRQHYGNNNAAARTFQIVSGANGPLSPSPHNHPEQFERKIHHFRGHEYMATYLDGAQPVLIGNEMVTPPAAHQCQSCKEVLGDDGRQCYQCRLCNFYCHKKCYTHTKPCEVSIVPLKHHPGNDADSNNQTRMIHQRTVRRGHRRIVTGDFVEDFSDELVRASETAKRTLLDDYVLEDVILGSGQFGVVKRGYYRHAPEEKVAIKIIDKRRLWAPRANGAPPTQQQAMPTILQRELDILKKLDHPGIIRMHNFVDMPMQTLVIMDLAPDGDLLGYVMAQTKLPESETRDFIRQVMVALQYLHDNGIVHRDLKPENLLMVTGPDGTKRVQIADFGFATMMQRVTGMPANAGLHSIVGTPAYMAPEIVDSRVWKYVVDADDPRHQPKTSGYDKSADMWSLGVICYVCLGGVFPFDTQRPVLDQVLRGEFFFPDEQFGEVTDCAIDFICNLLVVNPLERYQCSECLHHPWLKNVQA